MKLVALTVNNMEVRGLQLPAPFIQENALNTLFNVEAKQLTGLVFDNARATVWVGLGKNIVPMTVPASIKSLEDVAEGLESMEDLYALKFFCFLKKAGIASIQLVSNWDSEEIDSILTAELDEEESVEDFVKEVQSMTEPQPEQQGEADGQLSVVPETTVQEEVPANGETPAADENTNTEKEQESVDMTQVNKAIEEAKKVQEEAAAKLVEMNRDKSVMNENNKFTTVLQYGPATVIKSKALRLKAGDKSSQVMSLQAYVLGSIPFIFDTKGNALKPLEMDLADSYSKEVVVQSEDKNGKVKMEKKVVFSDNVRLLASEHNKVELMKIKESETAFILSNESAQSRIASQGKLANVEVYTASGEVASLRVQDATNLAVLDFNTPPMVEIPEIVMNTLFYGSGIHFRTRAASADIMSIKSVEELVQYTPSNSTPSQERQAKVTFIAQTKKLDVYDYLEQMGNEIRGYGKKKTLTLNGKEVEMFMFDVQKNSKRFGLLGSASKELKGFSKVFGKLVKRTILGEDAEGNVIEEFVTSTGLKVLNAPDVKGLTTQMAKVFNTDIANYNPGHSNAKPSLPAFINWVVNLTDGGIVSDESMFGPLLVAEGLVAKKRNGRMRGYAHQFRMNFQVKGLNVVAAGVKELTGYDMILFDGARKTDLLGLLEDGRELEYHVMLVAATFKEDAMAGISAQAMNNLNVNHELVTEIASENIAKVEAALLDTEKRDEAFAMMNDGKDLADMVEHRNILSKPFGVMKFVQTNPVVWEDVYAKLEIKAEIIEFMKTHKGGYLHVNAKNNYMFTDLFAVLKAVGRVHEGDMSMRVKEDDLAANKGEVVLPMMDAEGNRYFHEGDIMSIRSPHVVNDETQFAKAVNPLKSENAELAKYWALWLEGGFIDGITFFTAIDLMVPASSGADFDGDTSLIILEKRIVDAVEKTPQYVNFHTKIDADKPKGDTSAWAYKFNESGVLVGGYLKDGKLATVAQYEAAMSEGLELVYSKDSNVLLGEGCPWKNPAAAPAFNLPKGYVQDGYNVYIPADKIDSAEAYKAWVDAIHVVIGNSIQASDIGSMSNIVMAITNGINYVNKLIAKMTEENRMDEVGRLKVELQYMTNMREVFVPIVWYSIDAAKHGGEYKTVLKAWMKWCENGKTLKAESQKQSAKSMSRVCGPLPKEFNASTREITEVKYGIILPNVIRQAKFQMASKKGAVATNLQMYANAMALIVKKAEEDRNKIPANDNNIRGVAYSILNGTDFNSGLAKKIYAYFSEQYEKQDAELSKEIREMKNATREALSRHATDFDSMNNAKQTAMVKRFFPNYQDVRSKQKQLLAVIRQQLRMELIKRDMDIVKFAASAYLYAYELAIDLEKRNAKANAKAPVYALWKLLDEELVYMLASVDGARIAPAKAQNIVFGMTNLYFVATEAFHASAKKIQLNNKELAITSGDKGMNVYLVEAGKDVTDADLIGICSGYAAHKLVNGFSYRVSNPRITNVGKNNTGITMDLGTVYCYGNKFEGVQGQAAKAFYNRTASAKSQFPIALYGKGVMEDLQGSKFVAINSKGVTFFGIEVEGKIKPVAKALTTVNFPEGVVYELDAQVSDFTGQLTVFVYGSNKR